MVDHQNTPPSHFRSYTTFEHSSWIKKRSIADGQTASKGSVWPLLRIGPESVAGFGPKYAGVWIYFESSILRIWKRIEVVVVSEGVIFVVKFKVGTHSFDPNDASRYAKVYDQIHDFLTRCGLPTL